MEDNKIISEESAKTATHKNTETKVVANALSYNPDEYLEDNYLYDDIFYYNENCFSCKHWRGYTCDAPDGICIYEAY